VVIQRAELETLKNKSGEEDKLVLYFVGWSKAMTLNRVSFDSVADITGEDDSDNWSGHKIELYPATTEMNGREVDCVRIRAPQQGELKAAGAKPSAKPASTAQARSPRRRGWLLAKIAAPAFQRRRHHAAMARRVH
jgi:hypothetical protein